MLTLPQSEFRGKKLTFAEFCDLAQIGMAGLTDYLLTKNVRPYAEGKVNYRLIVDGLGLSYEPEWLDQLGVQLENAQESIATHDSLRQESLDEDYWVYLNSGFNRIASLLYDKYYIPPAIQELNYEDFRDLFFFEFTGMVQDGISETGASVDRKTRLSYDLSVVAAFLDLPHEPDWIARITSEFIENGFLASKVGSDQGRPRYELTQDGFEHAQSLSEKFSAGDGFLLSRGQGTLFFSVDASHISRLGMELVAKQETAVAELVKNGYDADATNVDLIFSTASNSTSLEIYDNGSGMSIEQLEAGFMRLSTPNKVINPRSDLFFRQKAGRKGIGRFAAQRLGSRLVLETTTLAARTGLRLDIDWDEFSANRNLSSVPSKITRIKKPFEHGTRLTILNLRDSWSDAQIERSHRHIAELIQPFPLAATTATGSDPGFKASFARERNGDIEIIADDWSVFFKHALAEIDGQVDDKGTATWTIKSRQYNLDNGPTKIGADKDNPMPYPHLRNVRFKAYYYIDKETQHSFRSKVADKLQSSGGIRLYRNGFRVLPYGERFDDWLKLNASNLLRKVLPPHSNRNFLGFVEISDVDGANFEETSSREGLLENDSFVELKDFVSAVLKTAILPIAAARDRKLTTTDTRQKQRSPKGQAEEILSRLNNLQKNASDDPDYALALAQVVDTVRSSVVEIGNTGQALLEELGMMRVLASLGLTIGEFTHEIRLTLVVSV
jgi:hypothetical protein